MGSPSDVTCVRLVEAEQRLNGSLVYGLVLEQNTAESGRTGTDGVRGEEEKAQCG